MPINDQAFIDVQALLHTTSSPIAIDEARANLIEQACGAPGNTRGVVVHFAPGDYVLSSGSRPLGKWVGDLTLPRHATAWFEPGARIIMLDARLVIDGGLQAPAEQIFVELGRGMVLLGGELDAVLPEWWGARGERSVDDSGALQRAVDAASTRRMPINHLDVQDLASRRPLPVRLSRTYSISREIVVGVPIDLGPRGLGGARQGIIQFGRAGLCATTIEGLDNATRGPSAGLRVWGNSPFTPDTALLRLVGAFGARVDNIELDGRLLADVGLYIEPTIDVNNASVPVQSHAISVDGCRFRGARRTQVQIGELSVRGAEDRAQISAPDQPPGVAAPGRGVGITPFKRPVTTVPIERNPISFGDTPGLSVRGCTFECTSAEPDLGIVNIPGGVGITLRATNGVAMRVADCRFRGLAPAFINVIAGTLLAERCDFANLYNPAPSDPDLLIKAEGNLYGWLRDFGFDPPRGTDVYLGAEGAGPERTQASINPSHGYIALASCHTTSATPLFQTPRPNFLSPGRPNRSNLIFGCTHRPWQRRIEQLWTGGTAGPAFVSTSTSVFWARPARSVFGPSRVGEARLNGDATLSVVGCNFEGDILVRDGAAQSAVLACHVTNPTREPILIPAETRRESLYLSGGGLGGGPGVLIGYRQILRRLRTIVFGLQCLALVIFVLAMVGCRGPDAPRPDSALDAGATAGDLGHARDIPMPDVHDAPHAIDVVTPRDVVSPVDAQPDLLTLKYDVVLDARRFAPRDVVQRDIEVTPFGNPPFVTEFGPPMQARASCAEITDGDPAIAAPRLVFPMSPMRVTSQRPTLFWTLPPGVDGARVELCRDRCCTEVLQTIDAVGSSVRVPEALRAGVVFWRARGRVGARHGRDTSFTWEFGVRHRDAPTDTAWGTIKDINGDGFDDVAATIGGSPFSECRIYWGGTDGIEGSRFQALNLGSSTSGIAMGDFNGDGLADVVVYAFRSYDNANGVRMSGADLWVIYGHQGALRETAEQFRVGGVGLSVTDVNGDGYSDLTTATPEPSDAFRIRASIMTLYGGPRGLLTGGVQYTPNPLGIQDRVCFGNSGNSGDLNGDGYGDTVVGDYCYNDARGRAMVLAGAAEGMLGQASRNLDPESLNGQAYGGPMLFAARHGSVGDFDGDRIGDYIITNENWSFVDIYRGNRQQMLMYDRTIRPVVADRGIGVDAFVGFVSDAPDLDGDGRSEFVATCRRCGVSLPSDPEWGRGYVFVYRLMGIPSNATLPDLVLRGYNDGWDWSGTFGTDVAAGDYNGDGFDDLVIGDPESHEVRDRPYRGKLHVVFGSSVWGAFRRVVVFGESIAADRGVGAYLAATVNRSSGIGG